MKRYYSIARAVAKGEEEDLSSSPRRGAARLGVFETLNRVFGSYGFSLASPDTAIVAIHRGERKIGYALLGPVLMIEIYPASTGRTNWAEVHRKLKRALEDERLLEASPPVPELLPVEVHHGSFVGPVSTRPGESGLTPKEIVRLTWRTTRRRG